MTLKKKIGASALLSLILLLSVLSIPSFAANIDRTELQYFISVKDKNVWNYHSVDLYLGDKYISEKAYLIQDTTYIPLRAVSTLAGAGVAYDDR